MYARLTGERVMLCGNGCSRDKTRSGYGIEAPMLPAFGGVQSRPPVDVTRA